MAKCTKSKLALMDMNLQVVFLEGGLSFQNLDILGTTTIFYGPDVNHPQFQFLVKIFLNYSFDNEVIESKIAENDTFNLRNLLFFAIIWVMFRL